MSTITEVHTALLGRVQTLLPAEYKRLPNPHAPFENPDLYLELGYGIVMGPETNTNRYIGSLRSYDFSWTLVLCRRVYTLDPDAAEKADQQLLLLEDLELIKADVEKNVALNDALNNTAYVGHNGIEYVQGQDNYRFIMVRANLTSSYEVHTP